MRVFGVGEQDLWGTVPALHDVIRLISRAFGFLLTSQIKVADFDVTVRIYEDVVGLEVPMDDVSGMHVVDAGDDLVHAPANALIAEDLVAGNDALQVCMHQVKHEI